MTLDLVALKPLCTPRRGQLKKKPLTVTASVLAAELRAVVAKERAGIEKELGHFAPGDRARREAALAFADGLSSDALPRGLDAAVQADLVHMLGVFSFGPRSAAAGSLLALWLVQEGPAFAVRALALSGQAYAFARDTSGTWKRKPQTDFMLQQTFPYWETLREQLAIATEPAWQSAREAAAEMRETLPPVTRCGLAYLFPEEPAWATEAASAWLAKREAEPLQDGPFAGYAVLGSLPDRALAERLVKHAADGGGIGVIGDFVADHAALHGDAALPGLLAVFTRTTDTKETWSWARLSLARVAKVLACYDDPRVTELLSERLDDKLFGPAASEHLERFPRTALRVLAPALGDKSKKAARRVALLDAIVRAHPELALAVAEDLEPVVRKALERRARAEAKTSSVEAASEEAPRERWPAVLASPPWRSKKERPVVPVVKGLVAEDRPATLVLDDATRKRWSPDTYPYSVQRHDQEKLLAQARGNVGRTTKPTFLDGAYVFVNAVALDVDLLEAMWALPPFSSLFDLANAQRVLVRLGDRGVEGTLARLEVEPALLPAAAYIDSPRVSLHLARAFRRPTLRVEAQRALARFPRTHASALVPVALSGEGKDAELATTALRWLATSEEREAVLAGAAEHGPEARAAIETLLSIDPLELCPAKPPRLSDFADPAALPRLRLKDGSLLPEEAVRNLLEMLQFSPVDPPYAGLARVREACDRASLDALLWALVQAWERAGGSSASSWALHAVGHLGSDSLVKLLSAEIRRWPREKAKARALLGLEVLARMGTDVALLHLDELSRKGRNRDVEEKAKELLARVAEERDLSALDLEDRLVPTLELDERGARVLAIGPRTLTVRFDEQLVPYLVDAEGKRADKILKAKGDEPDELKRAQDAWKELKADAAQVARALIGRLERAMCDERRWELATFQGLFVAHPVTQHLGRRLVWGTFEEHAHEPKSTFRVAEDGTLADVDDDAITLGGEESIGLVHPVFLEEHLRTRWSQRLGEYELTQPFEQLARRVERVAPGAEREAPWTEAQGKSVGFGALLGALEARGWRMGSPDGDGIMDSLSRTLGGVEAVIGFAPGIRPREERPERVEISVSLVGHRTLETVPALVYAEITRDLAMLGLV